MPHTKSSSSGFQLFEDDGTPIKWTEHHANFWTCGYEACGCGIHKNPFPSARFVEDENWYSGPSEYGICWQAGHDHCATSGYRTPAGRKRKLPKPDALVTKWGAVVGVVGPRKEFLKFLTETGLSLEPDDGQLRFIVSVESALILLRALTHAS